MAGRNFLIGERLGGVFLSDNDSVVLQWIWLAFLGIGWFFYLDIGDLDIGLLKWGKSRLIQKKHSINFNIYLVILIRPKKYHLLFCN
jgi:hypothetical protein